MFDPYRRRREKATSMRERRMGDVDLSLPVDGDLPSLRTPSSRAGDMMDAIVADLVRDRSPFFDEVCAKWRELFPDLTAKPGKWVCQVRRRLVRAAPEASRHPPEAGGACLGPQAILRACGNRGRGEGDC